MPTDRSDQGVVFVRRAVALLDYGTTAAVGQSGFYTTKTHSGRRAQFRISPRLLCGSLQLLPRAPILCGN
jgi:hypothetical protein